MSAAPLDATTLWVCLDCALWHANAQAPDDEARSAAVTGYPHALTIDCGHHDALACDPFSWSSCDACGSPYGGERHRAYLLT